MVRRQRHHHCRVLAALRLVDRNRVGERKLLQLLAFVLDHLLIEFHMQVFGNRIAADNHAHVTVEDLLVVIVLLLHHFVANPEFPLPKLEPLAVRIEDRLQTGIEIDRPRRAPVHWRDHLDVEQRVHAEAFWNACAGERKDFLDDLLRFWLADEVEITERPGSVHALQFRKLPLPHGVGVERDAAALALPIDVFKPHHRNLSAFDAVEQDGSGSDRRELIHVTHQHQPGLRWNRVQQHVHEQRVNHGRFVQHEQFLLQRFITVALEAEVVRL